jgi:hypothetical protein
LNSPYCQLAADAIAGAGPGYKMPSYHDMRIHLLSQAKQEVTLFLQTFRHQWADTGCTLMADGWLDRRNRCLINFLVYSPTRTVFLKSVDASDVIKTAENIFYLLKEMIDMVGGKNVVQVVTDNAVNYVAAGRLVEAEYPTIFWSPCAAHCLNLIMKDISEMDHVADAVRRATAITKFIYNHIFVLSLLRKRDGWTEIVRPGPTRFATTFIALQSLVAHSNDLQYVFLSADFRESRYGKDNKGKTVQGYIMDQEFWRTCRILVRAIEPLVRVLRLVDSDDRPAMGYLYEAMDR